MPKIIIFAGANGAGKTTVARLLLPKIKIREFVNADEIARGLSPLNPAGQAVMAGRLVLKRMDDLIAKGENFAIETTLSGLSQYRKLQKAKNAGYEIEMYYVFSHNVEMNVRRVKERVKQGGHDVPEEDVRRRYWRSLENLMTHYPRICAKICLYDTAGSVPVQFATGVIGKDVDVYDRDLYMRFIEKLREMKNGN